MTPLLTSDTLDALRLARRAGAVSARCSLDLQRSVVTVGIDPGGFTWEDRRYPDPDVCKERTVYHWHAGRFEAVARYTTALIKLVPTDEGPPTFEIDGIKMLPSARVSPYADAGHKVGLIKPLNKIVLDTCGGLGYFAAWCLRGGAARVLSFEKNADVLWLRSLNPWSPAAAPSLSLTHADVTAGILALPGGSVDAVLHDPPRFGIAGELYSQDFYDQLARVLKRNGRMFHYTGSPNKHSRGRDLAAEVIGRLQRAGFAAARESDGVLASRR